MTYYYYLIYRPVCWLEAIRVRRQVIRLGFVNLRFAFIRSDRNQK